MLHPAPSLITPDCRYSGDDWQGTNALEYVVYAVPPVYVEDANGVAQDGSNGLPPVIAPGTGIPLVLTGYTVRGTIQYRPKLQDLAVRYGKSVPFYTLPTPAGAVLDAANGLVTLSLPRTATNVPPQPLEDWDYPELSALIARPQIVDPMGNVVTVGLQPLFVF